jgi:hypothetical protein
VAGAVQLASARRVSEVPAAVDEAVAHTIQCDVSRRGGVSRA